MSAVEFRPLIAGHLRSVAAQPAQRLEQVAFVQPEMEPLLFGGRAEGAWVDHRIVAAAGLVPLIPGEVLLAWCLLSRRAGRHMTAITRRCVRMMDETGVARIEMYVNTDVEAGERWALAMGFERETVTPLRKRGQGGKDQHIFARVR